MSANSTTRFSNRVDDYVKYRPSYPVEIISFLKDGYALSKNKIIADVGSGTGILAALFLNEGYRIIAIEPNPEMRNKAIEMLDAALPGFKAQDGTAEATGLASDSIDVILVGQAFHWFDALKTRAEFKRILKPNGLVALIWNERKTTSAFEKEYDELIVKHAHDYVAIDHRNIDATNIATFFAPKLVHLEIFSNKQVFDFEGLKGRLFSSSYMPARNEQGHASVVADLQILFNKFQQHEIITINYNTQVYVGEL